MTAPLTDVITRSHDDLWETRRAAAVSLGALLPDAAAQQRLIEMIDDPDNTAVGRLAAGELARHGGMAGLAAVARAYATLDDDITYHIAGELGVLWHEHGLPLPASLARLASDDDPDVVRGAGELRDYLHTDDGA